VKCEHTCLFFSSCKHISIDCFGKRKLNYLNTCFLSLLLIFIGNIYAKWQRETFSVLAILWCSQLQHLASSSWIHLHIKLIKTHGRVLRLSEIVTQS